MTGMDWEEPNDRACLAYFDHMFNILVGILPNLVEILQKVSNILTRNVQWAIFKPGQYSKHYL